MLNLFRKRDGQVRCQPCIGRIVIASGRVKNAKHRDECNCQRCRMTAKELVREDNPTWNGGKSVTAKGYTTILVDRDDPLRLMADKNGYVLEHRAVMARSLGRTLASYEHVHHLNGNRSDNRLENLEMWIGHHPIGVRMLDHHCPGCQCFAHKEGHTDE